MLVEPDSVFDRYVAFLTPSLTMKSVSFPTGYTIRGKTCVTIINRLNGFRATTPSDSTMCDVTRFAKFEVVIDPTDAEFTSVSGCDSQRHAQLFFYLV